MTQLSLKPLSYTILIACLALTPILAEAQHNIHSFPLDSSQWYFEMVFPDSVNKPTIRYARYFSKGDTTISGNQYFKVYRQIVADSNNFNDNNDTLRLFVRLGTDSLKVFMRFADSINTWGTNEFLVADYIYVSNGVYGDTIIAPFTFSKQRTEHFVVTTGPLKFGYCEFYARNNSNYLWQPESYAAFIQNVHDKYTYSSFRFFEYFGEEKNAWFGVDLDSMAINRFHYTDTSVLVKSAKLYQFRTKLFFDKINDTIWVTNNADCLVSLENLNAAKTYLRALPNPSQGILTLIGFEAIENIQVFDLKGRLRFSKSYPDSENKQIIDISSLPQGLYLVRINNTKVIRVIKN